MFSKRNDKSGHIREAEKNQSERGDLKKENKGLQKGEREDPAGNATGKEFQENKDKGQEGGKTGRKDSGFFSPQARLPASAPVAPQPSKLRRKPPPRACVASNLLQVFW